MSKSCHSGPPLGRGPLIDHIDRDRFARSGRANPVKAHGREALSYVACGQPLPRHEIRVVDATGAELGDRREGRIEFRGPSATVGYFHNPSATRSLSHGDWLDTGDLGYIADADLYVTGRVKDIIIRAGRNLHPAELEEAVGNIAGVRRGCVAVFASAAPAGGAERLVVVAETRATDEQTTDALRTEIVSTTVDLLPLPPDDVVLAPPRSVPQTSSGKIRRAASREKYEGGRIGARPRALWWELLRIRVRGFAPSWPSTLVCRTLAAACLTVDAQEVVMVAKSKVSALDHAMHIAHVWVNDVAKEFDTDDREFAHGVLRAWLHTLRDRLPVEAAAQFAAQLPATTAALLHHLPSAQMDKTLYQLPREIRVLLHPEPSLGA